MSTLSPRQHDAIIARLMEVRAKLTMMEETFAFPISVWTALYQEKLSLEHQLNDVGLKTK